MQLSNFLVAVVGNHPHQGLVLINPATYHSAIMRQATAIDRRQLEIAAFRHIPGFIETF